jgi:rep
MKTKNIEKIFDELRTRQDYLVVQANDLAKAFGNLRAFEHRILDYCFSHVTKDDDMTNVYKVKTVEILHHFGLVNSGQNYERVARAFKALNENTALYFSIEENGKKGIRMGQLFSWIDFMEDGEVAFKFSEFAAPYVFALRSNFYSFKLAELAQIKSKYAIIIMKLWEANRYKNNRTTIIKGDLESWQEWFLGKNKTMIPARFKRDCIQVGADELEKKLDIDILLNVIKEGRKVIGYEMEITDNKRTTQQVPKRNNSTSSLNENVQVSSDFKDAMDLWKE